MYILFISFIAFIAILNIVKGEEGKFSYIIKNLQLENPIYRNNNDCNLLYEEKLFIDEYINNYNIYIYNNNELDLFRKEISQEIYQRCLSF
jgi:hypothetical protein